MVTTMEKTKLELKFETRGSGKTYLITGGAGFIGHRLAEELLSMGHDVIVVDDLSLGLAVLVPRGARFIRATSGDLPCLEELCNIKIDGVYHFGMRSSSPMYKMDPFLVHETLREFGNVLEFVKKRGIKLIFASTSSMYNGNSLPWREGDPIHVFDFYTESRYYMERFSTLYYQMYGVKSIGLRLFAVYGDGESHKVKYASIISQMEDAKSTYRVFDIYGDGNQTRDFISVNDVVRSFVLAMESNVSHDIFNIGTGVDYTFNKVAAGIGVKTRYLDNPIKNYVANTLADTSKAERLLNFRAESKIGKFLIDQRLENLYGE